MTVLARATRIGLDLLFPPRCALCGRAGVMLCGACVSALPAADGPRCGRCWMPTGLRSLCRHCRETPPAFASARAAFVMDAGARTLAHLLKYEDMTALAAPMAELIARTVTLPAADVVVPVPLHAGRARSRGYNQALALARPLAQIAGLPLDERAARRIRATAPLAKTMHREERRRIVGGAFRADARHVSGRALLLVDDVMTTGATLDACATALREAGARSVVCVTWARAD